MSRVRTPGDGPKCRCGKPAVWSGWCQMEDGKGFCDDGDRRKDIVGKILDRELRYMNQENELKDRIFWFTRLSNEIRACLGIK